MKRYSNRRYEFPRDRYNLDYWAVAPLATTKRYAYESPCHHDGVLLKLSSGRDSCAVFVSRYDLMTYPEGWRVLMARRLREMRRYLRDR